MKLRVLMYLRLMLTYGTRFCDFENLLYTKAPAHTTIKNIPPEGGMFFIVVQEKTFPEGEGFFMCFFYFSYAFTTNTTTYETITLILFSHAFTTIPLLLRYVFLQQSRPGITHGQPP